MQVASNICFGKDYLPGLRTLSFLLLLSTFRYLPAMAMAAEAAFWGELCFRFWQMIVFWNPQDHSRRVHKPALGLEVILAACEAIFSAALTCIANLEAGPEVSKTK